jgi:hypothetical protein
MLGVSQWFDSPPGVKPELSGMNYTLSASVILTDQNTTDPSLDRRNTFHRKDTYTERETSLLRRQSEEPVVKGGIHYNYIIVLGNYTITHKHPCRCANK